MDAFLDDSKDTFANSRILFDQELSASSTPYLSVSEMQIKKHREKIDHVETFMECVQSPKLSCGSSCCKQEEVRAANLVGSIADVTNKLDRKYHSLIDSRNNVRMSTYVYLLVHILILFWLLVIALDTSVWQS